MGTSSLAVLSSVPQDWMIIVGCFVLFTAIALRLGTNVVCAFGLAWLVTPSLVAMLPNALLLSGFAQTIAGASVPLFFSTLIFLFFVFYQLLSYSFEYNAPLTALASALGASILILVVWAQTPALSSVWDFGSSVDTLFAASYHLWWVFGALGSMVFSRV